MATDSQPVPTTAKVKPGIDWRTLLVLILGLTAIINFGPWQWMKVSRLNRSGLMAIGKVVDSRSQWVRRSGTHYYLTLEWEAVEPDTGGPYRKEVEISSDAYEPAIAAGITPLRYLAGDPSSATLGFQAQRQYSQMIIAIVVTAFAMLKTRGAYLKKVAAATA